MFKIPQWEDDVPKSDVNFGKTTKVQKKKDKTSLKQNQQKSNVFIKTDKKKPKNSKKSKINNSPKSNEFTKQINVEGKNRDKKKNKNRVKTNPKTENNHQSEIKSKPNNSDAGDGISKKKRKPRKRKLEDSGDKVQKEHSKTVGSDVNSPSKAKKRKLNNDEITQEGSILIKQTSKKRKKTANVSSVENVKAHESKAEQKKEKLRQLLKLGSTRNPINVSGNNLRQRMLERLKSAQFRFLNEKLYTTSGSEAQKLFQSDPEAFQTYHQGYQQQVKKWPVNPLDLIVKRISKMPKSHVIADMGCGEAALSRRVAQTVHSFDLVAAAPGVTACDMAHTPLLAGAADAAVYCLALMGTDLTQYLLEANRVLKVGGHLLIAEVESRFDKVEKFSEDVQRLGFKLKTLDESHKVFFFMEFVKVRDPPAKRAKLPALTLKPCLYKRR